jgi:hypothetical protein
MRYFEFITEDKYNGLDNFVTMLKNLAGRYTSKRQQAPLNWEAVAEIARKTEFEMMGDPANGYETFKSLWDKNPKAKAILEPMVKNFNAQGIELNIPGAPNAEKDSTQGPNQETPQDAVEKMAAGAVNQQIAQNQQGVQV